MAMSDGTEIGGMAPKAPIKRKRGNPNWVKGGPSPNPSGMPAGHAELRALCRKHTPEAIAALAARVAQGGVDCVAAARALLEYGWGKPSSAPEDLEAVREASPLAGLTREQLLALARPVEPGDT